MSLTIDSCKEREKWKSLLSTTESTTENSSIRKLLNNETDDSKLSDVSDKTKNLLNSNLDAIYLINDSLVDIFDDCHNSKRKREALSFLPMLEVETAVEKEKRILFGEKAFEDMRLSSDSSFSDNLNNMDIANVGYKHYLCLDNLKQNQLYKNKYLSALNFDSRMNEILKSPIVTGPRVSQMKQYFENISKKDNERNLESRLSMPSYTYLSNKMPPKKSYFKNSTFQAREPSRSSGISKKLPSENPIIEVNHKRTNKMAPTATTEKKSISKPSHSKCPGTPVICRRFMARTNSPITGGVSRSPIRPVYQIRKIFSPKHSPRGIQKKKYTNPLAPSNKLVIFAK